MHCFFFFFSVPQQLADSFKMCYCKFNVQQCCSLLLLTKMFEDKYLLIFLQDMSYTANHLWQYEISRIAISLFANCLFIHVCLCPSVLTHRLNSCSNFCELLAFFPPPSPAAASVYHWPPSLLSLIFFSLTAFVFLWGEVVSLHSHCDYVSHNGSMCASLNMRMNSNSKLCTYVYGIERFMQILVSSVCSHVVLLNQTSFSPTMSLHLHFIAPFVCLLVT